MKRGDRVRVNAFEGVVEYVNNAYKTVRIVSGELSFSAHVPHSVVEVIAPPIKVGDVLECDSQLDELPPGSIVAAPTWAPMWKALSGSWVTENGLYEHARSLINGRGDVTVLRVGGEL